MQPRKQLRTQAPRKGISKAAESVFQTHADKTDQLMRQFEVDRAASGAKFRAACVDVGSDYRIHFEAGVGLIKQLQEVYEAEVEQFCVQFKASVAKLPLDDPDGIATEPVDAPDGIAVDEPSAVAADTAPAAAAAAAAPDGIAVDEPSAVAADTAPAAAAAAETPAAAAVTADTPAPAAVAETPSADTVDAGSAA